MHPQSKICKQSLRVKSYKAKVSTEKTNKLKTKMNKTITQAQTSEHFN